LLFDEIKKAFGFGPKLTAEEELRRFVEGLRSMTDEDLGIILAVATVIRVNMEDQKQLPMGIYEKSKLPAPHELMLKMVDLAKVARHFDRLGQTTDAVAAVAVLNTLRCLNAAEFRRLGRAIWVQLARGMPHVEKALVEGESNRGEPFAKRVWSEWSKIPAGLESTKGASNIPASRPSAIPASNPASNSTSNPSKNSGGKPPIKAATWPKMPPNS
jgi:hypothetical protein